MEAAGGLSIQEGLWQCMQASLMHARIVGIIGWGVAASCCIMAHHPPLHLSTRAAAMAHAMPNVPVLLGPCTAMPWTIWPGRALGLASR